MKNIVIAGGLITILLLIAILNAYHHFQILAQELPSDQNQLQDLLSKSLDYVHQGDISTSSTNILLHGINLNQGEFILLYDSTPFASKGHIAVNLPCNPKNPLEPLFHVLVGRAPDLFVMPLGYIDAISKPGKMCVYHGQFGFGDPVTDVVLQYIGDDPIQLEGPHSIVISTHEYYKPSTKSFEELQHNITNQ
ncbi:MAG TPA: hypothetical protein VHJ38_13320 [Nitrososphaeraceae archaeon]|nr:hypothetical protein [Nitrososphaeraceae archaeon]